MSHRNTNIENYLYYADSENLAGSNDDDKIVMFPTSAVTGLQPNGADKIKTHYRRQDGTHADNTAECSITPSTTSIDDWVNALNMVIANMQKDHAKGFVVIADTANSVSCNDLIDTAAGTVTLSTTAL